MFSVRNLQSSRAAFLRVEIRYTLLGNQLKQGKFVQHQLSKLFAHIKGNIEASESLTASARQSPININKQSLDLYVIILTDISFFGN